MKNPKKSIKEKYDLDDSYELIYIDYNDYIENAKDVERIVQEGNANFMWEDGDWFLENIWESITYLIDELEKKYNEISDEDREEIREYMEEHDSSDPIKQLLKNTSSGYFYYSLGFEIEDHDGHCCCEKDCEENIINEIMKFLKTNDTKTRESVKHVVLNAGYGGDLVILFEDEIEYLLNNGNTIEFGPKCEICIMDRIQGSGHSEPLNTDIIVEFDRKNLHCDEGAPGYSFTGEVCGLTKGFMDGCSIGNSELNKNIIKAKINEDEQNRLEKDKEYEKTYKEGKCTRGDINMSRHRDTYYKNEYPCGTHCPHCGHFWID